MNRVLGFEPPAHGLGRGNRRVGVGEGPRAQARLPALPEGAGVTPAGHRRPCSLCGREAEPTGVSVGAVLSVDVRYGFYFAPWATGLI